MGNLRDQLQSIYEEHGRLTAELVVEQARADDHPLHNRFEWDNELAGEAYRREQARSLIRSVRIKYADSPDGPKDVRAWVAFTREGEEAPDRSYEPTEDVVSDPISRRILLRDMEREWKQFKDRYQHMVEFAEMIRSALESPRVEGAA